MHLSGVGCGGVAPDRRSALSAIVRRVLVLVWDGRGRLDYVEWLRWPEGFVCVACGDRGAWWLGDRRLMCRGCGARTSPTAGTIFDRTRTPLTVWFMACWLFATRKDGISALAPAVRAGDRLLPDGVGDAASPALGARASRPRRCCTGAWRSTRPTSAARTPACATAAEGRRLSGSPFNALSPRASDVVGWHGYWMRPVRHCVAFSSIMSSRTPRSSATAGSPHPGDARSIHARARRGARRERRRTCCPACIASRRWPSTGCLAPTKAPSRRRTSQATSTSSSFASTAGARAAAGWSSTACSSSPSRTIPCATAS